VTQLTVFAMITLEDINRQKVAMIIFALEKAIGERIKNLHHASPEFKDTGTFKKIALRDPSIELNPKRTAAKFAVASSYFDEVLSLAVESSAGSSEHENLKNLQKLVGAFDIQGIRNAVSHPNRDFPECYWYRTAALASDPIIDKLSFTTVRLALQAAEQGTISLPPEDWFEAINAVVRNNLPREFEHEPTGLIGRQKEKRDLKLLITSAKYNVIAVVAPGGLGKTSLTLDALRDCSLEFSTSEWCDAIVFVSLKQERLAAEGVLSLSAAQTIDELRRELYDELSTLYPDVESSDFSEITKLLSDQRVLLCLDNLETLLINDPDSFNSFYDELSANWRVLITSRIIVDGAKTLSVGALTREGSQALAFKYAASKGLESPNDIESAQLVLSSQGNPLALRLMIDRYSNGHPLTMVASSTEKDIVAFSYRNLVETLSNNALMILEALFVKPTFVRGELVELLGIDSDATAEAVRQLTRTSLVLRSTENIGEVFSLSPSVRDLLRDNPRNIAIRQKVKLKIDEQAKTIRHHKSIQSQHGFSRFSEDYIPDTCPPSLAAVLVLAIKLLRARSSHTQLVAFLPRLGQTVRNYPEVPLGWVLLGRLHQQINDDVEAESYFRQAIASDPESPMPRMLFQNYLLGRQRPDEAVTVSQALIDEGWGKESQSDEYFSRRLWSSHLRSLIEDSRLTSVIELSHIESSSDWGSEMLRCAQAKAIINLAAPLHSEDCEQAFRLLGKSAALLKAPVVHERIRSFWWQRTFCFFCKETSHFIDVNGLDTVSNEQFNRIFGCIISNVEEAYKSAPIGVIRSDIKPLLKALYEHAETQQQSQYSTPWLQAVAGIEIDGGHRTSTLIEQGFIILTVFRVPYSSDNIPTYVFAQDDQNKRYYIPRSSITNFNYVDWAQLRPGSQIAAKDFEEFQNSTIREVYPVPRQAILFD